MNKIKITGFRLYLKQYPTSIKTANYHPQMKHKILNLSILLLTLSLLFTNTININAQQTDIGIVEPSVAAFIQYGTYPVDLSSGLPNISIPLYTISAGNLNLPLTLMYHAGGIKVDEEASWVGLGWSINYGGMISRKIHGLPDEMEDFSQMPTDDDITAFIENNPEAHTSPYLVNLALGGPGCSFEPDIYHIVAGNISSKYILNEENKPVFFLTNQY